MLWLCETINATRNCKCRSQRDFARARVGLEGRLCERSTSIGDPRLNRCRYIHIQYQHPSPMLPLAARRFAARCARAPSTFLRYASTKPNAKPSVKAKISKAFTEPKPPVLARYPYIYGTLQFVKWAIGLTLAAHVWSEYFFTLSLAEGISMNPTMNATGDWLLLSKRYRRGRGVEVGDMVSYKHPIDQDSYGVKRVVGMPGDFVLRDSPGTSGVMIQVSGKHGWDNNHIGRMLMDITRYQKGTATLLATT
jgi:signal peptidase I